MADASHGTGIGGDGDGNLGKDDDLPRDRGGSPNQVPETQIT
jgi:hypothetical protein